MQSSSTQLIEFDAVVREIVTETGDTRTLRLDRPGDFDFVPGQFVNVTLRLSGDRRVRRAYSIASSPLEPQIDLTVRRVPDGLVSRILTEDVAVGQSLSLKGPYGRFLLQEGPMGWVAGGSGIVPFRSMWRYLEQRPAAAEFVLLYSVRDFDDLIYRTELNALKESGRNIFFTLTAGAPAAWTGFRGRVDREKLVRVFPDFQQSLFYICGPPAMCDGVATELLGLGAPKSSIRMEKYD